MAMRVTKKADERVRSIHTFTDTQTCRQIHILGTHAYTYSFHILFSFDEHEAQPIRIKLFVLGNTQAKSMFRVCVCVCYLVAYKEKNSID